MVPEASGGGGVSVEGSATGDASVGGVESLVGKAVTASVMGYTGRATGDGLEPLEVEDWSSGKNWGKPASVPST